jgi:diguanylate cyclase (GGDEF)-like protein
VDSHLPVGRLAQALESMSRESAWVAIVATTALLTWANSRFPDAGLAPLYIPAICAACWSLGERAGYFVALVCAVSAIMPHLPMSDSSPLALAVRTTVRVGTYLFVAATIASFRRSFDRQRHLALRDRMTGALNGETFHSYLEETLDAAREDQGILLLAILDLDDFKAINNQHGHAAGDTVLRTFARGARELVRRDDAFGRIGGDEFVLLLRVRPSDAGESFARTLHGRVSVVLATGEYPVTCSMGALIIQPDNGQNAASLMNAVDQIMYRAKRGGKNAVEIGWAERAQEIKTREMPLSTREQIA